MRQRRQVWLAAAFLAAAFGLSPAAAEETPKHGGTLTFLIPADSPPSFDGHKESKYKYKGSSALPLGLGCHV